MQDEQSFLFAKRNTAIAIFRAVLVGKGENQKAIQEGMIPIDKKTIIIIALLIAACAAGYWYGGRVPDNGNGIDQIRSDINAVRQQQQSAAKQLETITNRIDSSQQSVTIIERRIESDQRIITSNNELAREGKSILGEVRKRN